MSNESIDKILAELQRVEMMLLYFQRTGKIPDIEREIVLSKLRNIYEFLLLIQLHKGEQIEKPLAQPEKSVEEPATSQIDKDPEGSGKFTDVIKLNTLDEPIEFSDEYSESPMAGSPAKDLPVSVTNPEINSSDQIETKTKPVVDAPVKPHPAILADKFQQHKNFLNEALANYQYLQNISKKYQTKPIKDISTAISLNDKFLYIKELFNNDGELYKKTIDMLNTIGDFNRAIQYIDDHFQWDINDFQVQKIMELIHRRYMPSDE